MARLAVPDLLTDPDFADAADLIRRGVVVNSYGETEFTETLLPIRGVFQPASAETLARLPEGAVLADYIEVWVKDWIYAESPNGYADVVVWDNRRWQVSEVVEVYMHFQQGYCRAICQLEAVNRGGTGVQ